MTNFESAFISGPKCSGFLNSVADFLDTYRAFGCSHLTVNRHAEIGVLIGAVDLTTTEKRLYSSQNFVDHPLDDGIVVCSYVRAETKPSRDRPLASTAVKALGSIASRFPENLAIITANAYYLDHTGIGAPQLGINCTGDTAQFDAFIAEQPHRRDGAGTPHITTRYANYHNEPIEVQIHFQDFQELPLEGLA